MNIIDRYILNLMKSDNCLFSAHFLELAAVAAKIELPILALDD